MSPTVDFDGRVVIVTGSGRPLGLGCAYARMLASRGARVVVNDVQDTAEVVAQIEAEGGQAVGDGHDISTDEGARGLVQTAVDAFGGVHAIVNNAGVCPVTPFPEMTWDAFDRTLRVHVYGSYFVTRYAWPYLIEGGKGRVVMISSKAALWAETPGITHYGAAKGALLGMTRQLALEGVAHGICVNAVFPTALTSLQHPRADELGSQLGVDPSDRTKVAERSSGLAAAVVAWLCHPDFTTNGEFFKAQAGEANRVIFAKSPGITDLNLSVEVVRDNFDTIMDTTGASTLPAYLVR